MRPMLAAGRSMSNRRNVIPSAVGRLKAIQRTMASSQEPVSTEKNTVGENDPVLFSSDLSTRTYILNREKKLNALDEQMIDLIRPRLRLWEESDQCRIIVGRGKGRGFCAGGDVKAVTEFAAQDDTRPKAAEYFRKEFEFDYALATLRKPYVAILDGITMGGGLGLAVHAPFRVATERAEFAMPETKIGYAPDVGATYFLPKLDGFLGTYLALTGSSIKGKAVYQHRLATHYVPSSRIPHLLSRLAALEPPNFDAVDAAIEEFAADLDPEEKGTDLVGAKRFALDTAFSKKSVEDIVEALEKEKGKGGDIGEWASRVLGELELRSPTALKVALEAQKRGVGISLDDALQTELRFATAFCNGASPDFLTGVKAVLVDKIKTRPDWQPPTLAEIPDSTIKSSFFSKDSPYTESMPEMILPDFPPDARDPMRYALPSEEEIGRVVRGEHATSGSTVMDEEEVVARFESLRPGKKGVKEQVLEVLQRKCKVVQGEKGEGSYLSWIH